MQGGNYVYTYEPPVFAIQTQRVLNSLCFFFLYVSPFQSDYFSKQHTGWSLLVEMYSITYEMKF